MKNTLDPNSVKYRVAQRKEMEDVTSIIHILYPNTSHMHPQNTRPGKHYHVHCTVERDTHLVPEYIANVPPEYTSQKTLSCTVVQDTHLEPEYIANVPPEYTAQKTSCIVVRDTHLVSESVTHVPPECTSQKTLSCTVVRDTHLVPESVTDVPPEYTAQKTLSCTVRDTHLVKSNHIVRKSYYPPPKL